MPPIQPRPDTFDRVTELGIILSTMSPAYKRLNRDDCVFLFVDHQVLCYLLERHTLIIDLA